MRIDQIHPAGWHPATADRIHPGADAASAPPGPLTLGVPGADAASAPPGPLTLGVPGADAASAPPGPLTLGVIAQWLLLGAVIAGTFLLHVLTAENDHSIHGAFLSPTITVSQSATPQEALRSAPGDDALASMVPALAAFVIPSGDRDSGDLSGCILFLVVTAAASVVLLLVQIGKGDVRPPRPTGDAGAITLRGPPPPAMPRLSLGVMRI